MALTGLTGQPIFRGNGQIDFGLTEKIGSMIGRDPSNVIPGNKSTSVVLGTLGGVPGSIAGAYTNATTPSNNYYGQAGNTASQNSGTQQYSSSIGPANQTGGGGSNGGGNGSNGGGGGDSRLQELAKMQARNPVQEREYQDLMAQQSSGGIDINAAFSPLFGAFNETENALRSGYDSDVKNLEGRYGNYQKQFQDEKTQLTQDAQDRQTDFQATIKSALDEAVRAFNALQQQGRARFGGASSAGQAVGELAQQEFLKQQGNVQQENIRGEREFNKEFSNINTFISQKMSDLNNWKEEALGSLRNNLQSQLANLNMQRGQTEAAKAQARISFIQDAINTARSIQSQDLQFRQQLAIAGVNQLQESAGKAFTPQEIQAYVQQFMGGNTTIATEAQTGVDPRMTALYNPNKNKQDELSKLQGVG